MSHACFVGVLGGMGPLAGAYFAERVVALTSAASDQAHIPLLLLNDPRIPDRSTARLHGGPDPLAHMQANIRFLSEAGVSVLAIPCNTAHLWFDALQASTRVPILHIIDAVVADLHRLGIFSGTVGLMGTAATLQLRLYQDKLEAAGFTCIVPDEAEMNSTCLLAIDAVKSNRLTDSYAPAAQCIESLKQRGAVAVVLGCTELPLAVPHDRRAALGVALTDSIDALARQVVERFAADQSSSAA